MTPSRYLRNVGMFTASLVAGTVLLNRLVDPYLVYGSAAVSGLNAIKSDVHGSLRLWKAHAITRLAPRAVLLGSSRTCFGLDPTHAGFTVTPTFNACLHFTNTYETFRYFQHAVASGPLEEAVVGLDLMMFNGGVPVGSDFRDSRLAASPTGASTPVPVLADAATTLLSLEGTRATLRTLWSNIRGSADDLYLENGMREKTHNARFITKIGGYQSAFEFAERGYMGSFGTWFPKPCRRYTFTRSDGVSTFDAYRSLLNLAHERKVKLRLLTSPAHARLYEAMRLVGLWPHFEEWKRQLAVLNEEVAHQHGVSPFPLFDFAVFDSDTTEEAVPAKDDPRPMRNYWETSHYTAALGDQVLDRVLGAAPAPAPGGFGTPLTTQSMDVHLAAIRAAEVRYRSSHPSDLARLEALAAETAGWRQAGTCP
ncbi:MAG: hypothetical protein RJA70_4099 [Pseudomonadota bacterium]|jgi:hypothetical protein